MSNQKKFGTFAGVFTPSILTILGVIMYLRMGWVVGNAGLYGTIAIIIIAHIISIATGLSISSISTDKKVGAGGVYYVLSRSLGLPIGGALGITLFTATAFSIALYMVGFAEIFNKIFEFGYIIDTTTGELIRDPGFFTNSLRITGSIGLLALTILALISTAIALKTQFIILGLIILSLFAIFFGDVSLVTTFVTTSTEGAGDVKMIEVFAIFFPAVTGFTAGVAMSGDLKNSKKSIPYGTMLSIIVGLLVYTGLALFLFYNFSSETLINNENLLYEITIYGGVFVMLGVWGATLSSALGGILGGPRILQAMSKDKITPKLFAKGVGKDNEPRNALILTVIIAEAGILIGDLNIIAEVVSMFYLAAYGFINLSFFLESWASADFNPTFKVKKGIGLIGFIATFSVMFQLNMLAMVAAIVIIGGIYIYLKRKHLSLGTGDIWQSVWSTIVKKGLRKMEGRADAIRNWKPNVLLFSGGEDTRNRLIEFSKAISGQAGIITNFDLIENKEAKTLFPKSKQVVTDEELEKYGIFGRRMEVNNSFKGIENIATTFGFSGIDPNTTLMPWPGETKDPIWFTEMTCKLIELDYNVLYLDYDKRWGFRKKEQIDLWWSSFNNNAELMLSLVRFITSSSDWAGANTRILLVNETNVENAVIEKRIQTVLDDFRVNSEIKIIQNAVDKKPIYELISVYSAQSDLVFIGIPEIKDDKIEDFVKSTNKLINTIGTTLLVKASTQFKSTDLKVEQIKIKEPKEITSTNLIDLNNCINEQFDKEIKSIDQQLDISSRKFIDSSIQKIEDFHHSLISNSLNKLDAFVSDVPNFGHDEFNLKLDTVLNDIEKIYKDGCTYELPLVFETFNADHTHFLNDRNKIVRATPKKIQLEKRIQKDTTIINKSKKIHFNSPLNNAWENKGIVIYKDVLYEFGYQNLILLHEAKKIIHNAIWKIVTEAFDAQDFATKVESCKKQLVLSLNEIDKYSMDLTEKFYKYTRDSDREILNGLSAAIENIAYKSILKEHFPTIKRKEKEALSKTIRQFPVNWNRNINLFCTQLQADISLLKYSTRINQSIEELLATNNSIHVASIVSSIQDMQQTIGKLHDLVESENVTELSTYHSDFNGELFYNAELLILKIQETTQLAISSVPNEVALLDAASLNSIREHQGSSVNVIEIQLDNIINYLTKNNFINPIQLELTRYFEQIKRVMNILMTSSFQIQASLDVLSKSGKLSDVKQVLNKSSEEINEAETLFHSINSAFKTEIIQIESGFNTDLEINTIIQHADKLTKTVGQEEAKFFKGIKNKYRQVVVTVQQFFEKVLEKKYDAQTIQYKDKFQGIISKQSIYLNFLDKISIKPIVAENLPFYYQQLFTGQYVLNSKDLTNRKIEVEAIQNTVHRIESGLSGGIMILGETLAGKTFLANHTVNHLIDGKVYRIKANLSQSSNKIELLQAFKNSTSINENMNRILDKTAPKSIFLIEDVEQWWLRAEDGAEALNEIGRIIARYGSRHYFILTANIHAYSAFKNVTSLTENIIETVILNPLPSNELIKVIQNRHEIGGMNFEYNSVNESFLSEGKKKKLFLKFYKSSNGNIGLALKQWITNINTVSENNFSIQDPKVLSFPELSDEMWRNLLYQLHIHKNLNRLEMYAIYGEENKNWINRVLTTMVKAGLIKAVAKSTFEINSDYKPYLEAYLYD